MKTEDNYYRVILETVWGVPKEELDKMTDEECENHYDFIVNKQGKHLG